MVIALDDEAFEPVLVEVAVADGVVRDPPAHGVRVGEPAEEVGQFALPFGPRDEVPVGGHDAVVEQAERVAFVGLADDAFEGFEVSVTAEHLHFSDRAVEDVIDQARGARIGRCGTWPDHIRKRDN